MTSLHGTRPSVSFLARPTWFGSLVRDAADRRSGARTPGANACIRLSEMSLSTLVWTVIGVLLAAAASRTPRTVQTCEDGLIAARRMRAPAPGVRAPDLLSVTSRTRGTELCQASQKTPKAVCRAGRSCLRLVIERRQHTTRRRCRQFRHALTGARREPHGLAQSVKRMHSMTPRSRFD